MDIEISGGFTIKFSPNLRDNMSTQDLINEQVFGYIEEQFNIGDCVYDSFNYNIKDIVDYKEILSEYQINTHDFEDFFIEYVSENFINDYCDKEYIFKRSDFEENYYIDTYNIHFNVTLCITLEDLCQKYNDTIGG